MASTSQQPQQQKRSLLEFDPLILDNICQSLNAPSGAALRETCSKLSSLEIYDKDRIMKLHKRTQERFAFFCGKGLATNDELPDILFMLTKDDLGNFFYYELGNILQTYSNNRFRSFLKSVPPEYLEMQGNVEEFTTSIMSNNKRVTLRSSVVIAICQQIIRDIENLQSLQIDSDFQNYLLHFQDGMTFIDKYNLLKDFLKSVISLDYKGPINETDGIFHGGSILDKKNGKIKILGRWRNPVQKGKTMFVKVNGELITLSEAKKLEKRNQKQQTKK